MLSCGNIVFLLEFMESALKITTTSWGSQVEAGSSAIGHYGTTLEY